MIERPVILQIPADHPAFAGHFPGRPIVPGVVLLDAVLDCLATECGVPAAQISNAKFLSPVGPGEVVELRYESATSGTFRFYLSCAERAVATGVVRMKENV
jgi:3-hydroxymyristoyl/3-hydroxydecanoyl-(acyl carrier protein) dehydratase